MKPLFEVVKLESGTILQGQVLENLRTLPAKKFNCGVTSPPYYGGVRDYATPGQWGKEKDPQMYLYRLAQFMREIWRVLRDDGIFWVNIGDVIIDGNWGGIPEQFYVNCLRMGWKTVSKPVWYKRNAMPFSTKKRFSLKYEMIYGFAKKDNYYFNLEAVKIPPVTKYQNKFNVRVREAKKGRLKGKYGNKYKATTLEIGTHNDKGERKQDSVGRSNYTGFNGRYDHEKILAKGKNPGDFFDFELQVLDLPVKHLKTIKHYAIFPPELPEILIKASCPKNGWVLDPFLGSGTTGLVAQKLKLSWIGIELKADYIKLAKERIKSA